MRLLFLGDVVGRAGRNAVIGALPGLRADWGLDFIAINAENAASGFGLTADIANQLFEAGADCLTLGDHAFDQKEMLGHIEREPRILRPLNYAKSAPGRGAGLFEVSRGRKVFFAVALGRVFMNRPFDDPFSAIDAALKKALLGGVADAVIVEIHAEAT
ncbi:MAG: metallophosphoesterase, partial [Xanthomonadales bacterium]|nr:metallophosphoesterase [Xanthomonadales bacterium]